jgi:S-adenosylmethionine:tRNA ribosyltransferase-isomerase
MTMCSRTCLVLNNTRVFPARLRGRRNTTSGAEIELLLLRASDSAETSWVVLAKPGKRVRKGDRLLFEMGLQATVEEQGEFGERTVRFEADAPVRDVLEKIGQVPLPPYIHRSPDAHDRERYQTVFSQKKGSVAAPTAGLHFTREMLARCSEAGASIAYVTLHVGLGTFAPLREEEISRIQLHEEYFEISPESAQVMQAARRLICVGTTSVRTVESAALRGGLQPVSGETNLFIYPGFQFRATGAMLTNFHLPQSSLLMLVCALGGMPLVMAAYNHAVKERYRFFSYGDCMLVL